MTAGRRSSPVPQLTCVGGTAGCRVGQPKVVQCYNRGWDGYDVQVPAHRVDDIHDLIGLNNMLTVFGARWIAHIYIGYVRYFRVIQTPPVV